MSVTKVELADFVYEQMKIDKKYASELVDMFFEELKDTLAKEGEIQLSGFGKFTVKEKKERRGRNPQTKKPLTISKRKVATFHHSQVLKDRLNNK
ncbi:integration host factor subunit alpha [bacterium]|jgi:integration host factor subunit alpha|nr:integration host factor subunit alpha [bacterium]